MHTIFSAKTTRSLYISVLLYPIPLWIRNLNQEGIYFKFCCRVTMKNRHQWQTVWPRGSTSSARRIRPHSDPSCMRSPLTFWLMLVDLFRTYSSITIQIYQIQKTLLWFSEVLGSMYLIVNIYNVFSELASQPLAESKVWWASVLDVWPEYNVAALSRIQWWRWGCGHWGTKVTAQVLGVSKVLLNLTFLFEFFVCLLLCVLCNFV